MKTNRAFLLALVGVIILPNSPIAPAQAESVSPENRSSTIIRAKQTVTATWKKRVEYAWEAKTTVAQPSYNVTPGQPLQVGFDTQINRSIIAQQDNHQLSGEVCVTNKGRNKTQRLEIHAKIQQKMGGTYIDIPGSRQTIEPNREIGPGETRCFPYQFYAALSPDVEYRNRAAICIRNYRGYEGEEACVLANAPFRLPTQPALTEVDKTATLTHEPICPAGFTCEFPTLEQPLSQSPQQMSWVAKLQTISPTCTSVRLMSKINIAHPDSRIIQPSFATTELLCPPSPNPSPTVGPSPTPSPTPVGCTQNLNFWKTHAGGGSQPDLVTPFLPLHLGDCGGSTVTVQTASDVLPFLNQTVCSDSTTNEIGKLYAQLLAALLNGAHGADTTAIKPAIAAANTFLVRHDCTDWADLLDAEKITLASWIAALDNFNRGIIGPGACSQLRMR